jgi:mersacidin/lichenicidin family type 2 lantibiotic
MNREQIIKAWKDEEYRESLGERERALVPDHPSGLIELSDAQLGVAGGEESVTWRAETWGCCNGTDVWIRCGSYKIFSFGCACGEIAPTVEG